MKASIMPRGMQLLNKLGERSWGFSSPASEGSTPETHDAQEMSG